MAKEYFALGPDIYNKRGMLEMSISHAPNGDLKKAAHRVANLLCAETAMKHRFNQQGIDQERERQFDVVG